MVDLDSNFIMDFDDFQKEWLALKKNETAMAAILRLGYSARRRSSWVPILKEESLKSGVSEEFVQSVITASRNLLTYQNYLDILFER